MNGHVTKGSDSSLYDEKCVNCGETDRGEGLNRRCAKPGDPYKTEQEFRDAATRAWLAATGKGGG